MHTYELDCAHDMTLGELSDLCTKYHAHYRSIIHYGPAGGNPYIQFIFNNQNDLDHFITDYVNIY